MSDSESVVDAKRLDVYERYESSGRSYCRSFPVEFVKATGSRLTDSTGREYIDFLSGAGALNYGHNHPALNRVLSDYILSGGPTMALDLHTEVKRAFIETFAEYILAPRGLNYRMQFTSPAGTSRVESALKLARKVTGRSGVVAFTRAFHGMSGHSLSVTASGYHRQATMAGSVMRHAFDGYFGDNIDTADMLEKLLDDPGSGYDLPAAVVLETVQGEGGLNVASSSWLKKIRGMTERLGIVLIIDEIQSGCGRTGPFFSFEAAGIRPDMVCLSKSISGSGLPMAILLTAEALDIWKPGEDNGTFRGNNLAFVTAAEAVRQFWAGPEFERRVHDLGEHLHARLASMSERHGDLIAGPRGRGIGLTPRGGPTVALDLAG